MRLVLSAMVAVGTAFGVVLWFGFRVHEKGSAIPDVALGVMLALAIAGISTGMLYFMIGKPLWQLKRLRIQEPGNSALDRKNLGTVNQFAYEQDPDATAACIHLEAIERAMRVAGIVVRRSEGYEYMPVVTATCRIHEAELRRLFSLPETVFYREGYQPERYEFENPRADIFCAECLKTDRSRSDIRVLHPDECHADTRWFPCAP